MTTCVGCIHHKVVYFPTPNAPDGVPGTYQDRCMRYAKPGDPDAIGWGCVAETADGPLGWPTRCGPERKNYKARET